MTLQNRCQYNLLKNCIKRNILIISQCCSRMPWYGRLIFVDEFLQTAVQWTGTPASKIQSLFSLETSDKRQMPFFSRHMQVMRPASTGNDSLKDTESERRVIKRKRSCPKRHLHHMRQSGRNMRHMQCSGSYSLGSLGSVYFWASLIQIQMHNLYGRIRTRILLSRSKKLEKT